VFSSLQHELIYRGAPVYCAIPSVLQAIAATRLLISLTKALISLSTTAVATIHIRYTTLQIDWARLLSSVTEEVLARIQAKWCKENEDSSEHR
jgi:hypothetical protein